MTYVVLNEHIREKHGMSLIERDGFYKSERVNDVVMTPAMAFHLFDKTIRHGSSLPPSSYQVNMGFDGNGYLFRWIYAGLQQAGIYRLWNHGNPGLAHDLDREYTWMMALAAEEFGS